MNRLVYLLGCIVFFSISATAQSAESWTTYSDLEQVKIEYRTNQCNFSSGVEADFYFIKLTNKTVEEVTITFRLEYYYNGECTTCHNDEYVYTFKIPASGSLEPTCDLSNDNARLAVIKEYLNRDFGYPLDKFEITNIQIQ